MLYALKLALLVYKRRHGAAPSYLADELSRLRGSTSPMFCLVTFADYLSHAAVNNLRPSFSGPQALLWLTASTHDVSERRRCHFENVNRFYLLAYLRSQT